MGFAVACLRCEIIFREREKEEMTNNVVVKFEPSRGGFRVRYSVSSPQKNRKAERTFVYNVGNASDEKRKLIDANLVRNVVKRVLAEKTQPLIWRKKPSEIRGEVVHRMNRIFRSTKRGQYLKEYGFGVEEETEDKNAVAANGARKKGGKEEEEEEEDPKRGVDLPLPKKSIFAAEKESANTKVFLAPSFSGKTTLMVDFLNKMTPKELDEYDKMILFTESTSAAPLKKLNPRVLKKMLIYDRFIPQFVRLLKKINIVAKNRFRFLLLLDDCLNLKGGVLIKLILTLRNANISTVISIQYSKLLSRSQRQSIHDYYLMNLKLEDLEYLMSGFLASHFRELFINEGMLSEEVNKMHYRKLAEKGMERLKGKVLHFDQRHDKIIIYDRGTKKQ